MNHDRLPLFSLIGRVLMCSLFIVSGIGKVAAPGATKAYIVSAGLPLPDLAYLAAVAVELGLGTLLLLGFKTKWVAALMALFTLATAFTFHAHFNDPNQQVHFLKNLSIAGGLVQFAIWGAGAWSLDGLRTRRA
ncbi:DoxX family protein [Luteibacter pinisoli]|uniref:DoxX family protein n=1 Tax=Luteibacter pinisoli TaxID=2589080 RepID=A0A4Y5Z170_9GAMM|nr:DoxX family protein [Luteibacter pinisoli]QDE39050.1 DoxX family protein [Luteibacter pinisoli]